MKGQKLPAITYPDNYVQTETETPEMAEQPPNKPVRTFSIFYPPMSYEDKKSHFQSQKLN